MCPIYKKRKLYTISILPIISKVFEKEIFNQLYRYLKDNSILSEFQSGSRPLHSAGSALIHMCDNWFEDMVKGKLTGVIFLDFRKALDSSDHSLLLKKVEFYGFSDRELIWSKSYLTGQQQQCFVNGHLSSQRNLLCGVAPGSFLGSCYSSFI